MLDARAVNAIKSHLFGLPGLQIFTILDGASVPDLPVKLAEFDPEHICLYSGELEPDLAYMAPYLAILDYDTPFTDRVLTNGWGEHWGIFGVTHADMKELRKHFRKFLMVYDEAGKSLYFRYYDPRVLRVYLPTCNADELGTVFGPVVSYLVEQDLKSGSKFIFKNGILQEDKVVLG